jgi:5-epi-alpha-selinene synthase
MSRNSADWHGKAISARNNLLDAWRGGARVLELAHHVRPVANDPVRVRPPRLYCPFPAAIHAEADRIEEGTIAWMKSFHYINDAGAEQTARSAQFGIRAARVHPTGDIEAIQLVSDLTVWLFLTDDVHVEKPGISRSPAITADHLIRSMRVLRDPDDLSPRTSASLLALQDISRRMRVLATDEQRHRLINGMQEFFFAACCEAITRSRRSLPSTADYISVRDAINCLRSVCFVFIEIVGGFELPGSTWCRTDLQEVVNKATRIVSNHHDILSGLRELSDEVPMNLPAVLAQEQGLPIAEAFARVGAIADADTHAFVTLCNRLLMNEPDPSVRRYVDGLKDWIRGNLDWSRTTGRYRVQQHESAGADLPLE